jgi:hypothetical protein
MLVLAVFVAVAGGSSARASAVHSKPRRLAPADQVALASSFRLMKGVTGLRASGDYLLLATTVSGNFLSTGWIVIDNRTGTRTALDPRCYVEGLGPPWILMACPPASNSDGPPLDVELYSLTDGTRQTITPNPGVPDPDCSSPPPSLMSPCAGPDAVGADWLRWDTSCSVHCGNTYSFQNIQTGELRHDPTNATTFVDLNSPALARKTCPGVQLIPDPQPYGGAGWGSITFYGQFALATGRYNNVFLERCGTRMRRLLANTGYGGAVGSDASAIVWQTARHLTGLFLPSLQRFTIPLPPAILRSPALPRSDLPVKAIVLTPEALYVEDGYYGRFWRTVSPAALPRNTIRPSVARSGSRLTCRRGSWRRAGRFSYAWRVNGIAHKGVNLTLAVGHAGERRGASCSVTASNAAGATTASSAQLSVG